MGSCPLHEFPDCTDSTIQKKRIVNVSIFADKIAFSNPGTNMKQTFAQFQRSARIKGRVRGRALLQRGRDFRGHFQQAWAVLATRSAQPEARATRVPCSANPVWPRKSRCLYVSSCMTRLFDFCIVTTSLHTVYFTFLSVLPHFAPSSLPLGSWRKPGPSRSLDADLGLT